jgi:hypothetical protein
MSDKKSAQPFDKLLAELDVMAKSMEADDKAIQDNDDDDDDNVLEGKNKKTPEELNLDKEEDQFGKSFTIKTNGGEEFEAIDGTELVKSLIAEMADNKTSTTKALQATISIISKQGEMIKSLQADVRKLGNSGSGRKTVLNIAERKPVETMAKSQNEEGATPEQFMTKALEAQKAGKITALDVSLAETYMNKSMMPPEDLVRRIYS